MARKQLKKSTRITKAIIRLLFFFCFLAFALWLSHFAKDNELLRELVMIYGYWAIFIISTISGFNLIVPIPAITFLPLFLESGLSFWLTIIIISLGMTLADCLAYFLGHAGREITLSTVQNKWFQRLDRWRDRNYWWPIIILALFVMFVPLPNELIIIPLAILGYRLRELFIVMLLGTFLFNLLFAAGLIHLI